MLLHLPEKGLHTGRETFIMAIANSMAAESICQCNITIFPSSSYIFSFICPFVHFFPHKYACVYVK